jgi:hypothetical protein
MLAQAPERERPENEWIEHRAQKWEPVFRDKRCGNKNLEQAA